MRRNDVASTSFRCRVPTRFLINQCQIITFLILKYDIIENSRIELRGIVLLVQVGGLLGGGGGGKGMLAPLSNYWGGAWPPCPPPPPPPPPPAPPPPPPPFSYAYAVKKNYSAVQTLFMSFQTRKSREIFKADQTRMSFRLNMNQHVQSEF